MNTDRTEWTNFLDCATDCAAFAAALPDFLARQRWYAAKGTTPLRVALSRPMRWRQWLWLQVEVSLPEAATQTYSLPLACAQADEPAPAPEDVVATLPPGAGQGSRVLYDALADARFCHALLAAMCDGERCDADGAALEFSSTGALAELGELGELGAPDRDCATLAVRRASNSSSNTALLLGQRLFLKAYRRLAAGINPEVEIGRFLTEVSPYTHIAPLAGALEYRAADGTRCALTMLQGQVASQGDAWSHTLVELGARLRAGTVDPAQCESDYRHWSTLGRRTGELHRALARVTGDADFDPQPISAADVAGWTHQVGDEAARTLVQLAEQLPQLAPAVQAAAERLLAARAAALARIAGCAAAPLDALATRYHGDFHLGQVLISGDDFVIIDFEGEPSRPLAERRRKHSPLRDVAGMLRSFNYAASSALADALAASRHDQATAKRLATLVADWEKRAATAFLDAYCTACGTDTLPGSALLELFLLEKAFYELRYELAHRPDWVHVPLGGLLGLLEGRG